MSIGYVSTKVAAGYVPLVGEVLIEEGKPIMIDSLIVSNTGAFDQIFLATNTLNETVYQIYLYKSASFSHSGAYMADKGLSIKPSMLGSPSSPLIFYSIFYRLSG